MSIALKFIDVSIEDFMTHARAAGSEKHPRSRLLFGPLRLCGCDHHMEAYQVKWVDDCLEMFDPEFEGTLTSLEDGVGMQLPQTFKYPDADGNPLEYFIVVTPYSR